DRSLHRVALGPGEAEEPRSEAETVQVPVLLGRGGLFGGPGREIVHETPGPLGHFPLATVDASPATALRRFFGHAALRFLGGGRSGANGRTLRDRKPTVQSGPDRIDLLVEGSEAARVREMGRRGLELGGKVGRADTVRGRPVEAPAGERELLCSGLADLLRVLLRGRESVVGVQFGGMGAKMKTRSERNGSGMIGQRGSANRTERRSSEVSAVAKSPWANAVSAFSNGPVRSGLGAPFHMSRSRVTRIGTSRRSATFSGGSATADAAGTSGVVLGGLFGAPVMNDRKRGVQRNASNSFVT